MATEKGLLLSKSPYYIHETGSLGFTSTIELRIWNGDFTSEPSASDYTLVKQPLDTTDTNVVFEIASLIDDSVAHLANVQTLVSSSVTDALWVNVKSWGGSVNRNDTWLTLDGYSDFIEGINFQPTSSALISGEVLYHYQDIPITLPVYISGSNITNTVEFSLGSSVVSTYNYTPFISSSNSFERVQYISESGNDIGTIDNIKIKNNAGSTIKTIKVIPARCSRYETNIISFINKFGVVEDFTFNLVSKENLSIKKETYKKSILNTSNGMPTYSVTQHQAKDYNVLGTTRITLSSNFIVESLNETISQLFMSDSVWLTTNDVTVPVIIKNNQMDYQKQVNGDMVNYTIELEHAFNKQNRIY